MRIFPNTLLHTAALLAALLITAVSGSAETKPRNMVFILIDDQRFDSLGILGHPFLETPNIDSLAKGGVLFENAFVTTSLCSPSRASYLSGQYAHTHGVLDNSTPLPVDTPTFPQELQKGGYKTAFVGKWHMGGESDDPRPGFDRWVSFKGQGPYHDPVFNIDGERVPTKGYTTDLITDYAVEFLEQDHDQPFFLYVSHKAVHADFSPAPRHAGSYSGERYPHPETMADTEENYRGKPEWVRKQRQSWHGVDGMYDKKIEFDPFALAYCETMRGVDDSVGRIVETLREQGELDSTLIVYASDNGFLFGEHGLIDKRTMYETSIRIPLIAHCPELFEGDQRRKEMILNIDFAPTFLETAGLPLPDTIQGMSYYPLLLGKQVDWRTEFLYEYYWERSFAQTPTVLGVRTDKYKLMRFHGVWDKYELYDIENDPHEKTNLLGEFLIENQSGTLDNLIRNNADPALREVFVDLSRRLDSLLAETGSAREPNWRPKP